MEQLLVFLKPVIEMALEALSGKYGQTAQVLVTLTVVMGTLRALIKPLVVAAQEYVNLTPDLKDNEKLAKILESKTYKAIVFFFDWFASVKLPKK